MHDFCTIWQETKKQTRQKNKTKCIKLKKYFKGTVSLMIVKTEKLELEISIGTDVVYFGSRTSGQIFKKWSDFGDSEKLRLEIIQGKVEKLILESEKILRKVPDNKL